MWKLAVSQLKLNPHRYIAILLAITLGTMFLAATLLVTSSVKKSMTNIMGAVYANSDLLILDESTADDSAEPGGPTQDSELTELIGSLDTSGSLEDITSVREVYPEYTGIGLMVVPETSDQSGTYDTRSDFLVATNRPDDPTLISASFSEGQLPESDTEIAIDHSTAERHGIAVKDTVSVGLPEQEDQLHQFTVVGVYENSLQSMSGGSVSAYLTSDGIKVLGDSVLPSASAMVRTDGDTQAAQDAIQAAIEQAGAEASVNTPEEQISESLIQQLGFDVITVALGGFALIALLVMMLVINNTFAVLVAQRTRQYALQRILGATRTQISQAVLAESLLLGTIGSAMGVGFAVLLMMGLSALAGVFVPGAAFGMDYRVFWVIAVGALFTVVASWWPAIRATRVSPLEAMHPVPEVTAGSTAGKIRVILGTLLVLAGTGAMLYFALHNEILPGIATGVVSFVGVLVLGAVFVPGVVYLLGWIAKATGIPGKMAQLNSVRNRSRTAATATALIVGTTLVILILTGGRTAQHNIDQLLAADFPVDVTVTLNSISGSDETQVSQIGTQVAETDGIDQAEVAYPVAETDDSLVYTGDLDKIAAISDGLTEAQAQELTSERSILVPRNYEAEKFVVSTQKGEETLDVVRSHLGSVIPVVSPQTAQTLGNGIQEPPEVWAKVNDPELSKDDLSEILNTLASISQVQPEDVDAPIINRIEYAGVIDTLMMSVIGLLGISVLIALVGVTNTLSLSAIERTRENALMRALGLTRQGLRSMMIWEALLITTVAALLGSFLGLFYGWAGSVALLGGIVDGPVAMVWPWWEILVVLVIAAVAGLLASLIPSVRAAKQSPVEGLASV